MLYNQEQEETHFLTIEEKENLMSLVKEKDYSGIKDFFLEHQGYDLTFTDEQGNTILHYLVKSCNKDQENMRVLPLAQLMLDFGLSHTAVNRKFKTPLDFALESNNTPLVGLFKGYPVQVD